MNKREIYKNRLEEHWMQDYYSWLTKDDVKNLRMDVRERKGQGHLPVDNTNGKATFYLNDDAELVLRSYYTDVLSVDDKGNVKKLWYGYSATTMRHINEFMKMVGHKEISKHEWVMMNRG